MSRTILFSTDELERALGVDVASSVVSLDQLNTAVDAAVNQKVAKSGDTMTGPLQMSNNQITGVAAPLNDADAANKKYVDDQILLVEGDKIVNKTNADSKLVAGAAEITNGLTQLNMNAQKIVGLANGTDDQDAVSKKQMDDQLLLKLNKTIDQDFDFLNNFKVVNLKDGLNQGDAVNRKQLQLVSAALDKFKVSGTISPKAASMHLLISEIKLFSDTYTNFQMTYAATDSSVNGFTYIKADNSKQLNQATIDPNNYEAGAVPAGKYQIQRVFMNLQGEVFVAYGQHLYDSVSQATVNISYQEFMLAADLQQAILIGYIIIKQGVIDASIVNDDCVFIQTSKFGSALGYASMVIPKMKYMFANKTDGIDFNSVGIQQMPLNIVKQSGEFTKTGNYFTVPQGGIYKCTLNYSLNVMKNAYALQAQSQGALFLIEGASNYLGVQNYTHLDGTQQQNDRFGSFCIQAIIDTTAGAVNVTPALSIDQLVNITLRFQGHQSLIIEQIA